MILGFYDIAMRVGRTQFLNNIIGEHFTFLLKGKSQRDETYNRNRVEGRIIINWME